MACTKVCQLELPFLIDEEVLWLQVPVQNLTSVTVCQSSQNLEQENLKPKHKPKLGYMCSEQPKISFKGFFFSMDVFIKIHFLFS